MSTLVPRKPKGFSCMQRELNSRHFHYTVSNCTETQSKGHTQTPIHRLDQPSPQCLLASPWKVRRAWGRGWLWVWTGQHRGKTHCAWAQNLTSGQLYPSCIQNEAELSRETLIWLERKRDRKCSSWRMRRPQCLRVLISLLYMGRRALGRDWLLDWTVLQGNLDPRAFFLRKRAAPIFLGKRAGDKVEYTMIFGAWLPSDVWYQMTYISRK